MTKKCPYCNSSNLEVYYNIKNMPIILSACPKSLLENMKIKDFEATICKNCFLGFNSKRLSDKDLKLIYDNYLYISPINKIGHTKYIDAIKLIEKYIDKNEKIVEIGCSEGYVLYNLKNKGYTNLLGIEPGPQAKIGKDMGIEIIQDYLNIDTFKEESIDCFILMHVFEHFSNPFLILESMKKQITKNGKIIIEVPNFDGYHYEHLFFYNSLFIHKLAKEKSLKVVNETIDKDKFVLRFILTHIDNDNYQEVTTSSNKLIIENYAKELIDNFQNKVKLLNNLIKNKNKIYWWGAGSSSIIYLNQIDKELLNKTEIIIIDGDKNKWGLFVPYLNIDVKSFKELTSQTIDDLVIASSFHEEIKQTLKDNNIIAKNIEIFE